MPIVDATLWCNHTKKNIFTLLKKGKILGFKYYTFESLLGESELELLSLDEAVNYVLTAELPYLNTYFQDTNFNLGIMKSDGFLCATFTSFGISWYKQYLFEHEPEPDLHRYGKLMLDLIADFKIYEFKIAMDAL